MYYIVLINSFLPVTGSLGVTGAMVGLVGWTAVESDRLYSAGQAGWSAKHCQALSARLMVRVSLLMKMAAQMWESLKLAHQTQGVQTALIAKKELLNAKCPEGDNIPEHINKLKRMRNDLSDMGKPVPDDKFKDILLLNMVESWSTFTMSYMAG